MEVAAEVVWPEILASLVAQTDLSRIEAAGAGASMLDGQASDAQIGGFLVGLASKGETTDEVLGMLDAMLAVCTPLDLPERSVDIVGVGGAPRRRVAAFNVSTMASFAASAAGVTVCKHGNRKASSTSGSFDLLEALGVNIEADPQVVADGVAEIGLGFAFARAHHPSMRHVGPARAQLGVPTIFNVLGPLAHPGFVKRQVIGAPSAERARQIAHVVADTDAELVWVVHGHDDLDELSLTGPAAVTEIRDGSLREFVVEPEHAGLNRVDASAVAGGDVATNERLARSILAGEPSPNRDMVVPNAAAAMVVAGLADDIADGAAQTQAAIDDGRASGKLDALISHTTQ